METCTPWGVRGPISAEPTQEQLCAFVVRQVYTRDTFQKHLTALL